MSYKNEIQYEAQKGGRGMRYGNEAQKGGTGMRYRNEVQEEGRCEGLTNLSC